MQVGIVTHPGYDTMRAAPQVFGPEANCVSVFALVVRAPLTQIIFHFAETCNEMRYDILCRKISIFFEIVDCSFNKSPGSGVYLVLGTLGRQRLLKELRPINTTMRGCEIKQLRWQDIDLIEKALTIRKSKTEAGERVIPLNADAWNTILLLYRRAKGLGEVHPEHYVFPACEASHFNPTRPQTSWRTAWRNLTRFIRCPACREQQGPSETCSNSECKADLKKIKSTLAGLRFHDLRHHAITSLRNRKPATARSWRLPDTSLRRCWRTTPM